jgi:predicted alpha/beta-fold hydrolase
VLPIRPVRAPERPGLRGHAWTIAPPLREMLVRRTRAPAATAWSTTVVDPWRGEVPLNGALRVPPEAKDLCVLVHGLCGNHDSYYVRQAAAALHARGLATLSLSLRGADRSGADVYHAGLTVDLETALRSDALAPFAAVHLLGFSIGGHYVLRWALQPTDARVRSVAAVCAPLDLASVQRCNDARRSAFYRHYVLGGLKEIHAACAQRGRGVADHRRVQRVRTFRGFDELVVVPRFGFHSVDDYYDSQSVGPRAGELRVPSLLVLSDGDPMVPPRVVAPWLPATGGALTVRRTEHGGHLGFPRGLDLGLGADHGLHGQVAAFFALHR